MKSLPFWLSLTIYLVMAIITFGHAYNSANFSEKYRRESEGQYRSGVGIIGAMFWPFYWSAQAFEPSSVESVQPVSGIPNLKGSKQ